MGSPSDTIRQLNSARDIVLRDPTIYPQVVPGVLPVISATNPVEQRRWGAEFLAETFASPVVSAEDKQKMCAGSGLLDTLKGYLTRKIDMGQEEDPAVVKYAVQCAASVYPFVFRHTMSASDEEIWGKMIAIKSSILRRMDTAPAGVRICCVKFVAMVAQVQTPGLIADPRRQEQNEVSLALVPREHAVLKVGNLEAEASGLLDRLLYVLQEDAVDALLVTATLNALSSLVQRRASISGKILGTVLQFNPLKLASQSMTGKDKVAIRSMTRTTMSFLLNVLKRNPQHNLAGRIQQHIERLKHSLSQAFSDANQLKRPAPGEPTDGLDDTKRQRIDREAAQGVNHAQQPPPIQASTFLPPNASYSQLYTLSNDQAATSFHVEAIPYPIVAQLIAPLMQSIDQTRFDEALNIVKSRCLNIGKQPSQSAAAAAKAAIGEEEDDYDPEATLSGDTEQIMNQLDQMPPEGFAGAGIAIGPFELPAPPPLGDYELEEYSKTALSRMFTTLDDLDREARQKGVRKQEIPKGFNRPTVSTHDREAWLTLIMRLATRSRFRLGEGATSVKQEDADRTLAKRGKHFDLSTGIREAILNYVMEDFRRRINVAISWLNEEWYCDRLLHKEAQSNGTHPSLEDLDSTPIYTSYTLRLLDSLILYLDTKDNKVLIRFISEIPALPPALFPKIAKIADDPERVTLVVQALLYLVMFRPPVREMALDALEGLWRNNEDARKVAERHLGKWRPEVVAKGLNGELKAEA